MTNLHYLMTSARSTVRDTVDKLTSELRHVNLALHGNPEIAFQEFAAHDTIANFLEGLGFDVRRSAYGLATSFEVEFGTGGSLVVFCAEYDALPGIGHGCGHNLIATSSIAAFLATVEALKRSGRPGRVRLLGTPAEEAGGGKAKLLDAGAFPKDTAAAIMAHPMCARQIFYDVSQGYQGLAALKFIATHLFKTEFHGKAAHAAAEPWNGVNAFDAAVAAYSDVALLRQHIQPEDRVHAVMEVGGTVPNVIPEYTRGTWMVRSPTIERANRLLERVKACIQAGASATGCQVTYQETRSPSYLNLTANKTLSEVYVEEMAANGQKVMLQQEKPMNASTDMGNVAHSFPTFHGAFIVPAGADVTLHSSDFAEAAGTEAAHTVALHTAKGMAMLAVRVLLDADIARNAKRDFRDNHDW
ncbi:hypothetical protein F5B22DRAFT_654681 [Xylaria bambusicola]|uniref:uncharacterized protein n=1 Tax=Xylaria bambusicola TaxID=326684 RepID=UPI00200804D6|nr:uncharacterized protein F5B22DRAFT_654681 [Xylaria bambusicola]KAI0517457.1 hypothetical protein F5B22DRAFT_654681 [Xylaria bambusicola]